MSWAWAAGEMISTPEDLNRFYQALLTGRVLRSDLLAEMLTTAPPASEVESHGQPARPAAPDRQPAAAVPDRGHLRKGVGHDGTVRPRLNLALAAGGIVAIVAAAATVALLHVVPPSAYVNPVRRTISEYALLDNG
jgi:hypothetical protein